MLYHFFQYNRYAVPIHRTTSPPRQPLTDTIEGAAIGASALCLVHCLALPLLLLVLPGSLAAFAQSDSVHGWIFLIVAPFAFVAYAFGYRRHRRTFPMTLGAAGLLCLGIALVPSTPEPIGIATTIAGSLTLVAGHILNWRDRVHGC